MNQAASASFGGFVRQRRREMDLTQEELARRVGCAAITLRKIEADDLRASVQIAERLAMALAIPLEERAEFVRWARSVRPVASELPPATPAPSMEEIGREDLTGRAIRGYALAERIGMGGMGSVYRAVQPNVEREVAVKIILPAYANHPDFIRRFEAEAQLVARLEHPHIVPLYDYWREPGVAYLVMRLLRGGNVQNLLKQGPLPIDATARMLEQICLALNTAHRIGVIHRDLKPANVLLDDDSNAYLADFGIAKNLGNPEFEIQTQADALLGSPQYMSPEQIRSLSIRPQTDIYCLGVMLYEMLTGALPFAGPTPFDMIEQHLHTPMPPLSARQPGLPATLDEVIRHATAKDPDQRYTDVLSFFHDFQQAVGKLVDQRPAVIAYEEDTDIEFANPFKGLRAFSEADAENFFGRETLIQQLLARLGEGGDLSRFLAVIGPSGSGKSSVVRAGLIPALRRGGLPGSENWFVVDMLPGKHPFEELEASLLRVAVNPPEHLLSQLRDGNRGLLRAVHRILPADESVELVLVIDQFEELFTLVDDELERMLLLDSLATAVLDERSRLHVIITLRADFTDKPLRYVDFGEMMNRRFEFVLPLTADEVERAVAGPAQHVGLRLEKGLVSTIIREAGNQPGTLPLLQYALSELFEKREGRTLTNQTYREIGGVLSALGTRAESIYSKLENADQPLARQLFLRLVTLGEGTEDTRRRVLREELENLITEDLQDRLTSVMDVFGTARLLTFDRDPLTRAASIEVAHEALLREWKRLREWLNESRADVRMERQLAAAVMEWQRAQCDSSFLLMGARLEQFEGWAANTTLALTRDEQAFLEVSIHERGRLDQEERLRQEREIENLQKLAETEKRRAQEQTHSATQLRKRAYYLVGALALAIVAALTAGIFANRNAINLRRSESQRLALEANNLMLNNGDPSLVALLAIRSLALQYTSSGDAVLTNLTNLEAPPIVFEGHTDAIHGVAISPDGKYLATGSQDKAVRLWDIATGQTIRVFSGHTVDTGGVAFSPDAKTLAAASHDKTVRIWDVATGQTLKVISASDGVDYVAFSPDGKYIAGTGLDAAPHIWDVATGQTVHILIGHTGYTTRVAYSPDGKYVLTGGHDSTARLWDSATGTQLQVLAGHTGDVVGVAFSPDAKYAATGDDHTVRLWDISTGQIVREFVGHEPGFWVAGIAFSSDGKDMVSVSADGTARLWEVATGQFIHYIGDRGGVHEDVAFSPDGKLLAIPDNGPPALVRVWNLQKTFGGIQFIGHSGPVFQASFSPDGKRVITASDDNTARILDVTTGQTLLILKGHTDGINGATGVKGAAISPDGKMALTAGGDGTARLWDAVTGKELRRLEGHADVIYRAVFSPDSTYVITASWDHTARVWDSQTGQTILIYRNQDSAHVNRVAISPDGKTVATSGDDRTARIWDPLTGNDLMVFKHAAGVTGLAFSPDGKSLVTGSYDGIVRLWDVQTGKELRRFAGHPGRIFGIDFSPDGKYVLSGGEDATARLWDMQTGQEVRRFTGHTSEVRSVAFSPDGKYILTASNDGTARLWLTDYHDTIRAVCSALTRDLTPAERLQFGISDQKPTCPSL